MREWHFQLVGDQLDTDAIAELFRDKLRIEKDENGSTQLVMDLRFTNHESQAALNAAKEVITNLNAIAKIVYENHENVNIGTIRYKDPSGGPLQIFIGVGSTRIRFRGGHGVGVVTNGGSEPPAAPKKIGDQILSVRGVNEHFDRALYLLGSLRLDWRGLYMVFESAADAHGGKKGLIAKEWVPDGQINHFTGTANSYKALGLESRHGSIRTGSEQAQQTLDEARQMIRTIMEKWFKELNLSLETREG